MYAYETYGQGSWLETNYHSCTCVISFRISYPFQNLHEPCLMWLLKFCCQIRYQTKAEFLPKVEDCMWVGFSKRSSGQKVHQNVYKCQQYITRNLDTYVMFFSLCPCNMGQQYMRQTLASIVLTTICVR